MRDQHLIDAFNTIFRSGIASRAQLARTARLSPASVSGIVAELLKLGLIKAVEGHASRVGRRAARLEVNSRARYVLGIDLQGTYLRIGLCDLAGNVVSASRETLEIRPSLPLARFISEVKKFVLGLSESEATRLLAAGVGTPAVLDRRGESMIACSRISWLNIPFRDILARELDLPVFLTRSVDAAVVAEHWFGVGRGTDNFLFVTMGGGIGAGILVGGRLYSGSSLMAGEFGHTSVQPQGPRCDCGNRGCLEMYASESSMLEHYRRARGGSASQELSFGDLIERARSNDARAKQVIKRGCYYLGLGITNLIHIFNPAQVILGGTVAEASDLFLPELEKVIAKHANPLLLGATRVVPSSLGREAGLKGSAAVALDQMTRAVESLEALLRPPGTKSRDLAASG